MEARRELRPALQAGRDRLKDCVYLDLALDSAVRTTVERSLAAVAAAPAVDQMGLAGLVVENLCLSIDDNEELVFCLKAWLAATPACRANEPQWALRAKAVMDRTRLALADLAERTAALLQPTAAYMGHRLGVESWAVRPPACAHGRTRRRGRPAPLPPPLCHWPLCWCLNIGPASSFPPAASARRVCLSPPPACAGARLAC